MVFRESSKKNEIKDFCFFGTIEKFSISKQLAMQQGRSRLSR
jgi:hypothetical protein